MRSAVSKRDARRRRGTKKRTRSECPIIVFGCFFKGFSRLRGLLCPLAPWKLENPPNDFNARTKLAVSDAPFMRGGPYVHIPGRTHLFRPSSDGCVFVGAKLRA